MKKTKVTLAIETIREELHEAWEKGQTSIDIRLGDIHSKLGWTNNLHTVGEAMFCFYQIFNDEGDDYQCSCKIIQYPEWRSSLTNLYGKNLTMQFHFPEPYIDIHKLLFEQHDKKNKKLVENIAVEERCLYEMNRLIKTYDYKNRTDIQQKFSECYNTFNQYHDKIHILIQKMEKNSQQLREQIEHLKEKLTHEKD